MGIRHHSLGKRDARNCAIFCQCTWPDAGHAGNRKAGREKTRPGVEWERPIENGGWQLAIWIWAGWAFAAAACVALLWNATSDRVGFLPSVAPKLAGTAGMVAILAALLAEDAPLDVTLGLAGGLLMMLAAFVYRRVAIFSATFAGLGIVYFFSNYAVSFGGQVTWALAVGLGGCGVALISSLMILTDER